MFSLSILLPPSIESALISWADQTPGATIDPQASHVTLLNFETSTADSLLVERVAAACTEAQPFHLVLDRAVHEPYLGKPGLDIVMLIPSDESAGHESVLTLRRRLLSACEDVIGQDTTVPEDGEFLPHLTMTDGLPPEEAAVLCAEAEKLHISFEVHEVAAWSNTDGSWRMLATLPLAAV